MPRQFPPEFRQRALRLLDEAIPEYESEFEAIRQVASEEHAELKRLKRENAELRRANEILRTASAYVGDGVKCLFGRVVGGVRRKLFVGRFGLFRRRRLVGVRGWGGTEWW
jgi:transposase